MGVFTFYRPDMGISDKSNRTPFMTYDQLNDVIMAVGLAPPKQGYFVDVIKHVLVLATSMKVQLVGIAITPRQRQALVLRHRHRFLFDGS